MVQTDDDKGNVANSLSLYYEGKKHIWADTYTRCVSAPSPTPRRLIPLGLLET